MRLVSSLLVAAALLAGPALAQDAPAAPAAEPAPAAPAAAPPIELPPMESISPTADRDFWCALAYTLTARAADVGGDTPAAMAESEKSQILFASIVTAMKKANMQEAQFNLLTAQYTARVLDPFSRGEGGYTKDVCEAAVPEAKAFVEANPAAPAPAAPAADAPAADAPAAPAAQ